MMVTSSSVLSLLDRSQLGSLPVVSLMIQIHQT
jgi:hypothetical protein